VKKYSLFGLVFVIIGSFIGAGFASGKEIANYFARHKLFGLFFAIVLGAVFYFFILQTLKIGRTLNHNNLYNSCFGKARGIIKWLVVVACFIVVGAMIAGNTSLIRATFNPTVVFLLNAIMLIFVGIIISNGYSLVAKANTVLLPIIIFVILLVCVLFLKNSAIELIAFKSKTSAIVALFNSIEYMSFNLISTGVFLIEIGKYYSLKQIKKASIISAIFITIMIFLISFTLIVSGEIMQCDLPIITMALNIDKRLAIYVSIVIFFALLTSLITNVYTISKYLENLFKNNIPRITFILIIGFLISLFGFSFIVVNFYSAIGVLGLFFSTSVALIKIDNSTIQINSNVTFKKLNMD